VLILHNIDDQYLGAKLHNILLNLPLAF